ncbi:MAG: hypothetical protein ACE3JN_04895 [Ectobacillus sp.]
MLIWNERRRLQLEKRLGPARDKFKIWLGNFLHDVKRNKSCDCDQNASVVLLLFFRCDIKVL